VLPLTREKTCVKAVQQVGRAIQVISLLLHVLQNIGCSKNFKCCCNTLQNNKTALNIIDAHVIYLIFLTDMAFTVVVNVQNNAQISFPVTKNHDFSGFFYHISFPCMYSFSSFFPFLFFTFSKKRRHQ
jgi:hypothetical protein